MSKQVLSIEQMQHLKELGVDTSKSNFYWHRTKSLNNYNDWDEWKLHYGVLRLARGFTIINCQYVRTFTLQDILDLLPKVVISNNKYFKLCIEMSGGKWCIYYYTADTTELISKDDIYLIDAAYEMLCWCVENEYVKTEK